MARRRGSAGLDQVLAGALAPEISPHGFEGVTAQQWPMGSVSKERLFGPTIEVAEQRVSEAQDRRPGHLRENRIRTPGIKYPQYPPAHGNRLATPEPFLNSADADRTSSLGAARRYRLGETAAQPVQAPEKAGQQSDDDQRSFRGIPDGRGHD